MIINSTPLPLKFIQRDPNKDANKEHLCTYVYTFYSPNTKEKYVLNIDEHMVMILKKP